MGEGICPWKKSNSDCKDQCKEECYDYQRQRVYCWEESLHYDLDEEENSLSLEECSRIIDSICLRYGISPPAVKDGRGSKTASCLPSVIQLPKLYRERITTVHEACHILSVYKDPDAPAHGPLFVRYLVTWLPEFILGLTSTECVRRARAFGLDIATEEECVPPSYKEVRPLMDQNRSIVATQNLIDQKSRELKDLLQRERLQKWELASRIRTAQRRVFPAGLPEKVGLHLKFHRKSTSST